MSKLSILSKSGKETSTVDLPKELFGNRVNTRLLYQAVTMYRASQRQGTASTKERADVSGGGAKPYRQKGTGNARAGSSRSPLWKGGGTVFGPHPRNFGYSLPQKMRRSALRESLNAKVQSKTLFCLDDLKEKFSKTKEFAAILAALKLRGKTLAVLDGCDESVKLVSRNIPRFQIRRAEVLNAYDILRNKNLLMSKSAFDKVVKRISGK